MNRKIDAKGSLVIEGKRINRLCLRSLLLKNNYIRGMNQSGFGKKVLLGTRNMKYLDKIFWFCLIFLTSLKLFYALSRPLFESGPDANGYMPAALGFADRGLFAKDIPGLPIFPAFYPMFMSLAVKISLVHWVQIVQVLQILLVSIGILSIRGILKRISYNSFANFVAILLVLSPAWFVASGEAMYESLLFFLASTSLYFLVKYQFDRKYFFIVLSSLFNFLALATHPRIVCVYILALYFIILKSDNNVRARTKDFLLSLTVSGLGVFLFMSLTYIRSGVFSLSTALYPSLTLNKVFTQCSDLSCLVERVIQSPTNFIIEFFSNIIEFWSPHSGDLMRGTWFHNISLLQFLENYGFASLSTFLGFATTILIFSSWIYGSVNLSKYISVNYARFFIFSSLTFMLTDGIVYGDNRHRLIALVFMTPSYAAAITRVFSYKKFESVLKRFS